jgi:hypothetical protein
LRVFRFLRRQALWRGVLQKHGLASCRRHLGASMSGF